MANNILTGGASLSSPVDWFTNSAWSLGESSGWGENPPDPAQSTPAEITGSAYLPTPPDILLTVAGLTMDSGSSLAIDGGTLSVQTPFVDSGGTITQSGASNLSLNGFSGEGALVLTAGSEAGWQTAGGTGLTVDMGGPSAGDTAFVVNSAFAGMITDLAAGQGSEVQVTGAGPYLGDTIDPSTNTITLDFTVASETLQFDPTTDPVSGLVVTQVGNHPPGPTLNVVEITLGESVCFTSGTRISTTRGQIAVEDLKIGDLAVTSSNEARPIVWIGQRTVRPSGIGTWPVRIFAGAFGESLPSRDLWLSPGHAVCVTMMDEVFVPIYRLVNGATITFENVKEVTYWHVELESHDVLLAEGLRCESYLDVGNRAWFGRDLGRLRVIDPDRGAESVARYARPVVSDPMLIAFLLTRLAERARSMGWAALDGDPDVHLLVDGRRIDPEISAGSAQFVIPGAASDVELRSRVFVPAQVGMGGDTRTLGLAVLGLRIGEIDICLNDPRIAEGFHTGERDDGASWRWTDGRLALPADLWADRTELTVTFIADAFRGWCAPNGRRAA